MIYQNSQKKDKNKLQQPRNEKEMLTALKGMQNNKNSGIDGLPPRIL